MCQPFVREMVRFLLTKLACVKLWSRVPSVLPTITCELAATLSVVAQSMLSVCVDVLNGATTCPTTTTVTLDTGDSLLVLKQRLCTATGLPATTLKLCCAGKVLLDDEQRIGSLPSTRLTAWGPRFTKLRSDKAFEAAEVQREVVEEQRRALARPWWQRWRTAARLHWPAVRAALQTVRLRTWLKFAVWFLLMLVCRHYRLGHPFVITSLIVLLLSNLGDKKAGDVSAYTVFNTDMAALPGQLRMEDLEREMRHA
jgi:hypothetical protein